jgi:hypothetical protein
MEIFYKLLSSRAELVEKWRIFGNFKRKLGKFGKNVCFFMENAENIGSFGKIWGSCKNFPVTF